MKRLTLLSMVALLLSLLLPGRPVGAQTTPDDQAASILAKMTPEERVGQLLLVSFTGTDAGPDTQIYDLITRNHVGGVMLVPENDNFTGGTHTVTDAYDLIGQLQKAEWDTYLSPVVIDPSSGRRAVHQYVPLFIGTQQDGDGGPFDQIFKGLTAIAPEMSIGSSWDTAQAESAGTVLGQELSSIGFNLYLGPSLDTLTAPNPDSGYDPGANVFGGNSFWVGEMAKAYVTGLHSGSKDRLAIVARNFPGRGDADRPPEAEFSTVRKTLEQLEETEFLPFYEVTGYAPTEAAIADGLLLSHVRYQALQGNIRPTTRPVSLDPQALTQLLALVPFSSWRAAGGLFVSDDLGTAAVRNFYAPVNEDFSARLVARDALLAGNDLLYMGDIVSSGSPDNSDTLVQTLDYFAQKYREDPAFARRVDESALRILKKKYELYSNFSLGSITPSRNLLPAVGDNLDVTTASAANSASLISPRLSDLTDVLPSPPGSQDLIVFITDERSGSQCRTCPQETYLAKDALESAVLRLYGPEAGGLVVGGRLSSFTFDEMAQTLPGNAGNDALEQALRDGTWVVFTSLDLPVGSPQGDALRSFITQRQDLLRNKRVLLFSLGAPYYLDATDISKFTAFYALYGKSPPFVNTAARLLFQELSPSGFPSVSVPGTGYDIASQTAPDPDQVIELAVDVPPAPTPEGGGTPAPTTVPLYTAGNSLPVRTGEILDANGHVVPDGTEVLLTMRVNGAITQIVEAKTVDGVSAGTFQLEKEGFTEIQASSPPAEVSVALQLSVSPGQVAAVTVVSPTQGATAMPTAAVTPVPTPAPPEGTFVSAEGRLLLPAWFVAILILGSLGGLTFFAASRRRPLRWVLRWTFCVFLGGLAAYNYAALGLPGSASWLAQAGFMALCGMILVGIGAGLLAAFIWEQQDRR
jgi:beta-N-acetylhexosaminidase